MNRLFLRVALISTLSFLLLSGCETSEERAERFYQSGLELLKSGDVDRALVEFRNVFQLDALHKGARMAFADAQRERGAFAEAYGQYLRVVEQYPDTAEALIALAEIGIEGGAWEEADKHGRAALALMPEDPRAVIAVAMLDYHAARIANDITAAVAPTQVATEILKTDPANLFARRILLDDLVQKGNTRAAADFATESIAQLPDQMEFHIQRLQLFQMLSDNDAMTAALDQATKQFPDSIEFRGLLVAWYMDQGNPEAAEAFLRSRADRDVATNEDIFLLVEFLRQTVSFDAGITELEARLSKDPENSALGALHASHIFDRGDREAGIAEIKAIVERLAASDEVRNYQNILARMYIANGDIAAARQIVDQVLAGDASNVEALKLSAAWMVDDDKPQDAIVALRTALSQAPEDPDVLTLMALAHERQGDRDLAGERYALAVEITDSRREEVLRYTSFLLADQRLEAAEAVLTEAVERHPLDLRLLSAMADVELRRRDWDRATRIIWKLRAIGSEESVDIANRVEAELLLRQSRTDETLAFLENLVSSDDSNVVAKARLVELQLRQGQSDRAAAFLDEQLEKDPTQPDLLFLRAGIHVLDGAPDEAEKIYLDLLERFPGNQRVLQTMYNLLAADGRTDDLYALLDEQTELAPNQIFSLVLKAGLFEKDGQIEEAIAIYEGIYAKNSGNLVVANNLASLLSTHREDKESLDRAFTVGQRLNGTTFPPFQDTYGWLLYLRGDFEGALPYLEAAAQALGSDPYVLLHLGMTRHQLGMAEEAKEALAQAIEIIGDTAPAAFQVAVDILNAPAEEAVEVSQ